MSGEAPVSSPEARPESRPESRPVTGHVAGPDASTGELLSQFSREASELVRQELRLAQAEVKEKQEVRGRLEKELSEYLTGLTAE